MADSIVKINITAEDKASKVFEDAGRRFTTITKAQMDASKQMSAELNSYINKSDQAATATDKLAESKKQETASTKSMFTAFTAANLAATAITKGIGLLRREVDDSIQAANTYQSALLGVSSAALAFGQDAGQTRDAVKSASSDGLVPLTANANALKNLLQSGLNLDQATTLLARFKDEAAFGRAQTIDYGQAVENLGQAYKSEQSRLGDLSGHQENFSVAIERGAAALGKSVDQLTAAEREQVKYTEYLQASNYTLGNAAEYAETAAGKQAQLTYEVNQAQIAFGSVLQPAVAFANQSFVDLIKSFTFGDGTMQSTQANILTLATVIAMAGNLIVGTVQVIYGAVKSLLTLSWKPLEENVNASVDRLIDTAVNYQEGINKIAEGGFDAQLDGLKSSLSDQEQAQDAHAAQMAKQMDKENQSYADSIRKRTAQFEESLKDMIIAHRDKSRSIQADIASENRAYAQQVIERQEQLAEDLADLEQTHADKVKDITKEISKEKETSINVDGVIYNNANQAKIADLEEELSEEDAAYQQARLKREADAAEDLAKDAQKHQDKLTQLQTSLDAELAILQQHASDVAAVGEAQKEDDISRLRRQFTEENAEAAKQHQQRLADLASQGSTEGATYAANIAKTRNDILSQQQAVLNQQSQDQGRQAAEAMRTGFFNDLARLPGDLGNWLETNLGAKSAVKGLQLDNIAKGLALSNPLTMPGFMVGKALGLFAEGGIINRPTLLSDARTGQPYGMMAEAGPEAIVPMGSVQQGLPSTGGMSLAIGSVVLNNQMDVTSLFRTAYWEMRR